MVNVSFETKKWHPINTVFIGALQEYASVFEYCLHLFSSLSVERK